MIGRSFPSRPRTFRAPLIDGIAITNPVPATVAATATVGAPVMPGTVVAASVLATATIAAPAAVGLVRTYTPTGTTQSLTGLTAAREYTARVRARDAAGNWSAWSTAITFTTAGAGSPSVVTVAAAVSFPARTVGGTPPTVVAGRARPVVAGGSVLLDVTATPPGAESIIAYSWTIVSGGGSLTNAATATPTYTAPTGSGLAVIRAAVSATNAGLATADVTVSYHTTITAAENALTGTARATWDLASPNLGGVSTLQGFVDGFSIDKTGTANFKVAQSDTAGWTAEVFRLGWYAGDGARSYGTLAPNGTQLTASQAQASPADADPDTSLISADCAGWSTTLTWSPPAWAPSGMYVLRLNRTGGGASHVMFVVRDDARAADLMLMPADSTWNAYNAWGGMGSGQYGGNSLYFGTNVDQYNLDCAHYVSYNRPVVNRGACDSGRAYGAVEWSNFFTGEFPMLRFVERNGFDVKYYSCLDAAGDVNGTHLVGNGTTRGGAKAAMFVGHNEYWSDGMRAGWERAKNLGVSIFSCASNEVFWRLVGTNADSAGRPRTWECQKSTIDGRGSTRPQWTGTWRDPDGAGKGGNNPENSFTGTIFAVNGPDLRALAVPFAGGYSAQPLWRNSSVASLTTGQTFTSPTQILGFEWDTYGPAGLSTTGSVFLGTPNPRARYCSDVTYAVSGLVLTDAGDVYGSGNVTHRLVVHPGGAGAVVFGTGSTNWALGVDDANVYQQGSDNTSSAIQQATVNMLVDMGATPATLMVTLVQPTPVDWYPDVPTTTVLATTSIPAPTVRLSLQLFVTAADTVTAAEATARTMLGNRPLAESTTVVEGLTRSPLARARTTTDTATTVDAGTRSSARARSFVDTVQAADTVAKLKVSSVAGADAVALAEAIATAWIRNRSAPDAVVLAGSAIAGRGTDRDGVDAVFLSDVVQLPGASRSRTVTDAVTVAGTALPALALGAAINDAVTQLAVLSRAVAGGATGGEALLLVDQAMQHITLSLTVADLVTLVAVGGAGQAYSTSVTDAVHLADTVTRALGRFRVGGELVGLVDTGVARTVGSRPGAEFVALVDTAGAGRYLTVAVADAVHLAEALVAGRARAVSPADTVHLVDAVTRIRALEREGSDFLYVGDAIERSVTLARTLSGLSAVLGLGDSAGAPNRNSVSIADAVALAGTVVAFVPGTNPILIVSPHGVRQVTLPGSIRRVR
jgi:hypothetical protein